jgi:hypothetical protein
MSAYLVFTREKTLDRRELEIYWQQIRATFAGHQGSAVYREVRERRFKGAVYRGLSVDGIGSAF